MTTKPRLERPSRALALTLRSTSAPYNNDVISRCQRDPFNGWATGACIDSRLLRRPDTAGRGSVFRINHGADRIVGRRLHDRRRPLRQMLEIIDLMRLHLPQLQKPVGQRLDAARRIESAPFGAQRGNGITFAADFATQLSDAFDLQCRVEFDLVDPHRGNDQGSDDYDVEETHAQRPLMTSPSDGSRGRRSSMAPAWGAASVRCAARSLAERARGLQAISSASATIGRLVSTLKLGCGRTTSGRCRDPPPTRLRSLRKVLTMRSSSEWNETTTSRPLDLSRRSAAPSAAAISPSSSLMKIRSAWNVRVAGWMSPGLLRTTRATMSASARVERIGASLRVRTMARATARACRSSPSMAMIEARSRSDTWATRSAALGPALSMRMSSGPSKRKENPRSG